MALCFPSPSTADADGLVAVTAALTPQLLLQAYRQGIFPWSEDPVRWYSPDPRAIIWPQQAHLPRNLAKLARRGELHATYDEAFVAVMRACAAAHARDGSWIGPGFIDSYGALHAQGHAHSVEVWQRGTLIGGLYGVQIGAIFAGESMFHRVDNASKVAFAALLRQLYAQGVQLIDAQVRNAHTTRLGAVDVPRSVYLRLLAAALQQPTPGACQRWQALP